MRSKDKDSQRERAKTIPNRTREALEGSIKKWQKIAYRNGKDLGSQNCPLCGLFLLRELCVGCPVAEASGKKYCAGTPYAKWAFLTYGVNTQRISDLKSDADRRAAKAAAIAELNFLRLLRPPKSKR